MKFSRRQLTLMKWSIPGILKQPVTVRQWEVTAGRFTLTLFHEGKMPEIPEAFRQDDFSWHGSRV